MDRYRVSSLRSGFVDVEAADWLSALSQGLRLLHVTDGLTHMAAETLPGGKILVRDVRSGNAYSVVVFTGAEPAEEQDDSLLPADEDEITASGEVEDLVDTIQNAPDLPTAMQASLEALRHLIPTAAGSVLQADSEGWLRFASYFGPGSERLVGVEIPPPTGVAGFCVDEHLVISLRDAYSDDRFFRSIDRHTGSTTKNLLCVPLMFHGTCYGCIELINVVGGNFSSEMLADAGRVAEVLAARMAQAPKPHPRRVGG